MRSSLALLMAALTAGFSPSGAAASPAKDIAREAATAAVAACRNLGFRVMATVVDSAGRPVAAMVADPDLAQGLAYNSVHTAQIAAYFHDRSSDIPVRLMDEPQVDYAIHDHPNLAPLLAGGVPFPGPETMGAIGVTGPRNGEHLDGIGVAGAPDGDKDEECARDGVIAVLGKLK